MPDMEATEMISIRYDQPTKPVSQNSGIKWVVITTPENMMSNLSITNMMLRMLYINSQGTPFSNRQFQGTVLPRESKAILISRNIMIVDLQYVLQCSSTWWRVKIWLMHPRLGWKPVCFSTVGLSQVLYNLEVWLKLIVWKRSKVDTFSDSYCAGCVSSF